jgi:host factor-I protein
MKPRTITMSKPMGKNGAGNPVVLGPSVPSAEPRPTAESAVTDAGLMYNQEDRVQGSLTKNSPTGPKETNMDKLPQNIQEAFLNAARKDRIFLTIYLMSGVKLSGRIRSFDKYSVVLESNNQEQLIFKHAISTVVVARPVHGMHSAHTQHGSAPGVAHSHMMAVESPDS